MLGINYYYFCDLNTAEFYHKRAMLDDLETIDSENKASSLKDLNTFINSSLQLHLNSFNKQFLKKLSLPITN